jgi:hypothetical protein
MMPPSETAAIRQPIDWGAELEADLKRMQRIDPENRERQLAAQPSGVPVITSPCEGCRHQPRCRAQKLACEAFRLHVNAGRCSPVAPRQPSAAIFAALFGEAV